MICGYYIMHCYGYFEWVLVMEVPIDENHNSRT